MAKAVSASSFFMITYLMRRSARTIIAACSAGIQIVLGEHFNLAISSALQGLNGCTFWHFPGYSFS
jgi:hypothetical protein